MNRCIGCGAVLQSEDQNKVGYIPKEKIKTEALCERCFRLIHYNDLKQVVLPTNNIIDVVNKQGNYAFFLVDLLNINQEVFKTFKKIEIPKTLIVSKIDYIPKYIKKEKIKNWLKEEYKIEEDILFLSAAKNVNVSSILNTMMKNKVKKAYLLGFTNAGKSTLVNRLQEETSITTSIAPNTTIDYIEIPLEEGYYLIDSPGFQYQNPIYEKKDSTFLKKMSPKTFLKPITYQLKKGTSLIIEDILRIENKSDKCNLTLYISNLLKIKKVYEKNEELKSYKSYEYAIKKNEDVVVLGLGFINIKSNCKLRIYIENPNWIELRNSFFER